MTKHPHPITPPPELVEQWCHEDGDEIKTSPRWFRSVCAKAAQWGADQELEACCKWMERNFDDWDNRFSDELRAARRSKPLSLAEQATAELDEAVMRGDCITTTDAMPLLRAAINRLAELEVLPND